MNRKLKNELSALRGEYLISHINAIRICRLDAKSHEIISESSMKSYRVEREHRAARTANILNDFFERGDFVGKFCMDIGPGHYNFSMLAQSLGADVIAVERNPVHAALGRHLGFKILEENVLDMDETSLTPLDGLWLKNVQYPGSYGEDKLKNFVGRLNSILKPKAWGWVVLRNGMVKNLPEGADMESVPELVAQRRAFEVEGWSAYPVLYEDRKRYGLKFLGSPWIFLRNLRMPRG
jgi:hypothetical protein